MNITKSTGVWIRLCVALILGSGAPSATAGTLLVDDRFLESVLAFDSTTGAFVKTFVSAGSGGLQEPGSMIFGPDGNLYVISSPELPSSAVLRYNGTTGAFIDTFVPSGSGGLAFATDLTFGPDGNLYVTSGFTGPILPGMNSPDSVLRFNGTTGAFIGAFVPAGGGGLTDPGGLAFGKDGNLYINSGEGQGSQANAILRFNGTTGNFLGSFVPSGSGGLMGGADLIFGPDGNLYTTNQTSPPSNVLRFDGATGGFLGTFVSAGSGGLTSPFDLAFGPDGNLYVTDIFPAAVRRYNGATGGFIDTFITGGSGGLTSPADLVFAPGAPPAPVPEPTTFLLLGAGALLFGLKGAIQSTEPANKDETRGS
jgi:glucose/arabinose dehydrogenase